MQPLQPLDGSGRHNDDLSLDISENDEKNSSCNENKKDIKVDQKNKENKYDGSNSKLSKHKTKRKLNRMKTRCEKIKSDSRYKCNLYKYISMIHNISVILEGCLVTLISSLNFLYDCNSNYNTILIILGVLITAQKSVQMIFNFDRKSIEFKKVNIKTKKILRQLNDLNSNDLEINSKIKQITEQLDDLEFNIFLDGIDDK